MLVAIGARGPGTGGGGAGAKALGQALLGVAAKLQEVRSSGEQPRHAGPPGKTSDFPSGQEEPPSAPVWAGA